MIKVIVSTALRDLARLGAKIEDYPKTRRGAAVKVLEQKKPAMQELLKRRLKEELHKLGPGFASGSSRVEKYLRVGPGKTFQRGVSGFSAFVDNEEAAKIANAWNTGAVINPKRFKYLAQPISDGKRVVPAISYDKNQYSTWVYEGTKFRSRNPNVEQDVVGLMVIRSKSSFVLGSRLNKKGVRKTTPVPAPVASYVLMRKQTIKGTRWIHKATQTFREVDFPVVAKELINEMKSEKLT